MANTRDIRRRIKSVKNTSQITKAMQMVAAAKMRKAQSAALAGRPYAELLNRMLLSLSSRVEEASHPLLNRREGKKELVILISTDKGLCGALNTNLFRELSKFDSANTQFVTVGRKGVQFLMRTDRKVTADFPLKDNFTFLEAKQIAKFALEKFIAGEVDRVSVLFTDFVNTLTQLPKIRTVLPITDFDVSSGDLGAKEHTLSKTANTDSEFIFEPDANSVLEGLLPHYVYYEVYQMILDSRASEHSARMVAMKNATDNAKQLIKDLTLEYNKVRQASITTEILEIATAQAALS